MARGIKRRLRKVSDAVNAEISAMTNNDDMYSRGLASEGYLGGYRDCLMDVLSVLSGYDPTDRSRTNWWKL